jgi:asparagine synthase (glutamine-hydrolysing)
MCRIAGIINKNLSRNELTRQVKAMADAQRHGGPDDEGFFLDEEHGLALGHRRLSLLDLSPAGHQPMHIAEGRYRIVFNGEIYNFKELRTALEKLGHSFNSSSDTEVILYAFLEWGINSFNKLKGMFAFALADHHKNELYLVRDAQGIKPLYYYQQKEKLAFASEVKAFEKLPWDLTPNPEWPLAFLSFGHLPEPMTTLKGVFMLTKGHYLKVSMKDEIKVEREAKAYMEDHREVPDYTLKEAQDQLNEVLDGAIRRQLVADAPIGVFLSGGIDSSLLALQAAKYQGNSLLTVSLHFPEAKYSEKKYQEIISRQLSGQHITQEINQALFNTYFEEILNSMDQPSVDGINSWFVSKAAHDAGLKAVLSGIGADELFGGYPSFRRINKIPKIRKYHTVVKLLASLTNNDALQRAAYLKHTTNSAFEYLFLRGFYSTKQLEKLFGIAREDQHRLLQQIPEPFSKQPGVYNGRRASWYEQHFFMQNQLLKDADSMSMQHGLEIRVPFLDQDVVKLANSLPANILFDRTKPAKHLLINAFDQLLPNEIWDRPKMGFTFPFQEWIKEHSLYNNLKSKHADSKAMQQLFAAYEKNKVHWSKIMSLLVLEKFESSPTRVILSDVILGGVEGDIVQDTKDFS